MNRLELRQEQLYLNFFNPSDIQHHVIFSLSQITWRKKLMQVIYVNNDQVNVQLYRSQTCWLRMYAALLG